MNTNIRGQRVSFFFQTNDVHRLAMLRKSCYPAMKKSKNRIIKVDSLRNNKHSHIDVIIDMYIMRVSPTEKTTLQGPVLVGSFLCLGARLTVDMQVVMLTMYF